MKVFFVISLLVYLSIPFDFIGAHNNKLGMNILKEVYAWNRISFNIDGYQLTTSRSDNPVRQTASGNVYIVPSSSEPSSPGINSAIYPGINDREEENDQFFNQYNNIPFGIDKWHDKLFITIPRIENGIPSTLNYVDLKEDKEKSPSLRPYPDLKANSLDSETPLVSVFRTRIDVCDRLWMLDTGATQRLGNLTNQFTIHQPPTIVIYDLKTNERVGRYELKINQDYMYKNPTGFGSITVDVSETDCGNAYAYIPNYITHGLVVYSLKENASWRVNHNFFSFDPEDGDYNIAGLNFQWDGGICSVALGAVQRDGYRTAYFHALSSNKERSVNTRILRNQTLANTNYRDYMALGERGPNTQTSMHVVQFSTGIMFKAVVGRSALACWNTNKPFNRQNLNIIVQDYSKFIFPSDVKIDGEDLWVITNSLPLYFYSKLKKDVPNFRVYKMSMRNAVARTVCA